MVGVNVRDRSCRRLESISLHYSILSREFAVFTIREIMRGRELVFLAKIRRNVLFTEAVSFQTNVTSLLRPKKRWEEVAEHR